MSHYSTEVIETHIPCDSVLQSLSA